MKKFLVLLIPLGISTHLLSQELSDSSNHLKNETHTINEDIPSQQDINELKKTTKQWGWFLGLGAGGTWGSDYSSHTFFMANFNGGIILPHSPRYSSIFSIDIGITPLEITESLYYYYPISQYLNTHFKGYTLDFTLNYNLSYTLYQSDIYQSAILVGIGLGGRHINQKVTLTDVSNVSTTSSVTTFIMNSNFGFRNIFSKNHALDFVVKFNALQSGSTGDTSIYSTFGSLSFFVAYTFLKF
ncbi:hypothetical protein [Helicobacter pametensis]|uniref:hypothetical protein n=1 Tax=Helicobacter pametensis TaxID=95149 RepID=UPI0004871544|nr:hypothetical protein [Helicobacter pametensis]